MPSHVIVVEKRSDFRWPDPGGRVVTADEYVAAHPPSGTGRNYIVNLCRNFAYLGAGYYVALLAEARGDRVGPDVRTIVELNRKDFVTDHVGELSSILWRVPDLPRVVNAFSIHVYAGEAHDPAFHELAQRAFDLLRCPLLRLDFERAESWRLVGIHAVDPRDVPADHDEFFLGSLERLTQRRWQRPRSPSAVRFDLAVLHDPNDPMPPSKPKTLAKIVKVGAELGVNVVPIERKDYPRLAQFDGLLIRETTGVAHHTFRFARKAEREGMPVIDDPTSILRCANKVFLAELLRGHGIPTPATHLVTRRTLEGVETAVTYPAVLKIPDGSFSRGVKRAADRDEFQRIAEDMLKRSEIILVQEFIPTEFDWRIGVLDGEPLFAARYFMCGDHWQILKHGADGSYDEGPTQAVAIEDAPPEVAETAMRAARLVGRGLYGVDLKQTPHGVLVMEVNDNPNIDVGLEDVAVGDELYRRILRYFLRRAEEGRPRSELQHLSPGIKPPMGGRGERRSNGAKAHDPCMVHPSIR